MWADAVRNSTCHPYQHNLRSRYIIGVLQELFNQFASALSETERSVTAVTGVGIAPENHPAAGSKLFSCKLMNDRLICGDVNPTVFSGG